MVREMEAKYVGQGTVELTINFLCHRKIGKVHTFTFIANFNPYMYFCFFQTVMKWNHLQFHYTNAAQVVQLGKKGSEVCWYLT